MKKILKVILQRLIIKIPISVLIPFVFVFIHRSILNQGGYKKGMLVHEDFYGFVLCFSWLSYFSLSPLPKKYSLTLLLIKAIIFAFVNTYMIYILSEGYKSSYFHRDNYIAALFPLLFLLDMCNSEYIKNKISKI